MLRTSRNRPIIAFCFDRFQYAATHNKIFARICVYDHRLQSVADAQIFQSVGTYQVECYGFQYGGGNGPGK